MASYAFYSLCCQLINLRFDLYQVQEQPAVTITFLAWSSVEVHSLTQTICSYLLCFSFCMLFLGIYSMLLVTSGPNFTPQHPVLTFKKSYVASINVDLTEDWLIGDTLSTVRSWAFGSVPSVADLAAVRGYTDYSLILYLFLCESESLLWFTCQFLIWYSDNGIEICKNQDIARLRLYTMPIWKKCTQSVHFFFYLCLVFNFPRPFAL